jgi:putative flippase GtrA
MIAENKSSHPVERSTLSWLIQAGKFSAVGVLNTLLDMGLYYMLTRWLGLAGLPVLAKAIAYTLGVVNSFFWNRHWTFQAHDRQVITFLYFFMFSLVGLLINAMALQAGLKLLGLQEFLALCLATMLSLTWNYLSARIFVFNQRPS